MNIADTHFNIAPAPFYTGEKDAKGVWHQELASDQT